VVIDVYAKNQPKDAVSVQLSDSNSKLCIVIAAQQQQQPTSSAVASEQPQQHEAAEHPEDYTLELELYGQVLPGALFDSSVNYCVWISSSSSCKRAYKPVQAWHWHPP
jgi:hypothetical protein